MKNYSIIALTGLFWLASAGAQDLVINDDCTVELDASQAVNFEADGNITVTTAEPIPANCVDAVIAGGGAVALSTSKDEVEEDETFSVSYAVPEGNFSCVLRRNSSVIRNNNQIDRPNGTVFNQTITSDATYEMSCDRNSTQGIEESRATARVDFNGTIIDPPPNGTECDNLPDGLRTAAVQFQRNNSINGTASTYNGIFGAFPLAESLQSSAFRVTLDRTRYVSVPFTVPQDAAPNATVTMTWEDSTRGSTSTIVSVSDCIGGILAEEALPQTGLNFCHVVGRSAGGSLKIGVNQNLANCLVERGRTYYLNVMDYSESTESTTCGIPSCWWLVQVTAIGAVDDSD